MNAASATEHNRSDRRGSDLLTDFEHLSESPVGVSSDALEVDRFFNFGSSRSTHPGAVGHNPHHQLPWMIGSSGQWPPQTMMMGLGHDHPYHDHHHRGYQHHSLFPPPPVMPTGQPSSANHHQLLPPQSPSLQVIPTSFSAVWPKEWPSQDQHFAPSFNDNPMPNLNEPSPRPALTVPELTQPMIPNKTPMAPKRERVTKVKSRTSRRRLMKAKTIVDSDEDEKPVQDYTFIPSNTGDFTSALREQMRFTVFNESLLPTTAEIASMVKRSWETAINNQSAELRDWAQDFRRSQEKGLANIVDSIRSDMKDVARLFVFFRFDLQTYQVAVTHLINRGDRVLHLTADDSRFLDVTLTINGRTIVIPFGNPAVMAYIGYLLYDSRYQYHRYISGHPAPSPQAGPPDVSALSVEKLRPLFTMTAILFRWALEERKTGAVIDTELWVQ
ncbi:uncharacterized protein F5891DRAFT_1199326 [Suillus fuscotomentosus]|uniref:Uncharacterized protein n=1 Tax=Suillus fuscotomentosus TaxID=1912939 RepID=A0AAD4HDK3_9AGAM|nr:uncharacterized protein F5891DRAFT_1199326 [Suillus fuscotomentosus]KAG1888039.1 hypothetical protein F5891DRAFT_1199326 [Suillus fuscotomentosus]